MKELKKAFTIVELVIVIAVIAILAAVLVPTFSNMILSAKVSNDNQTVAALNVALTAASSQGTTTIRKGLKEPTRWQAVRSDCPKFTAYPIAVCIRKIFPTCCLPGAI